jgi:hypothetical protein
LAEVSDKQKARGIDQNAAGLNGNRLMLSITTEDL